jgi:hypothetical protein
MPSKRKNIVQEARIREIENDINISKKLILKAKR